MKQTVPTTVLTRVLMTLIGVTLIAYGVSTVALGFVGAKATGVITNVRRQGGERDEAVPGRYTYGIGYRFTLPDGRTIEGSDTKVGGSAYVKASGTSIAKVRYFKSFPHINVLEGHSGFNAGQVVLIAAGALIVYAVNSKPRR